MAEIRSATDFLNRAEEIEQIKIGTHIDITEKKHLLRHGFLWQLETIRDNKVRDILRDNDILSWRERQPLSYLHNMPKKFLGWKPVLCRKLTQDGCVVVTHKDAYILYDKDSALYQVKNTEVIYVPSEDGHTVLRNGESIGDAIKRFATPVLVLWLRYQYLKNNNNGNLVDIKMVPVRDPIPFSFWWRVLQD